METAAWRNLSQGIWRSHKGPEVRRVSQPPLRVEERQVPLATDPEMYQDAEDGGSQAVEAETKGGMMHD